MASVVIYAPGIPVRPLQPSTNFVMAGRVCARRNLGRCKNFKECENMPGKLLALMCKTSKLLDQDYGISTT
jgi:hypothetical protein